MEVKAVVAASSPQAAHVAVGSLGGVGLSGLSGSYRVGPLHAGVKYVFTASKEGYHFRSSPGVSDGSSFIHQRLGDVVVSVVNKHGEAVPGVLVSLSSDAYRNNSATNATGHMQAAGLFPGLYFVRPMLKEYSFAPSSSDVHVDEGGLVTVSFLATRVAYSALGYAVTLNGAPVKGAYVAAVADASGVASEEASVDAQGQFRIRGLVPGVPYTITVKNTSSFSPSPPSRLVTVTEESGVRVCG